MGGLREHLKTTNTIALSELQGVDPTAVRSFVEQLRRRGFALVSVDDREMDALLQQGLVDASKLEGFRFPPHDAKDAVYTPLRRLVFRALLKISVTCLRALIRGEPSAADYEDAIRDSLAPNFPLFSPDFNGHDPFTSGQPFGQSFFNLFNYNEGLLNPHYDRSLMTVIKVRPGQNEESSQTALWAKNATDEWTNVDLSVGVNDVVVMIGEDAEGLAFATRHGIYAAEHAVRVTPDGEYIPHSHFQRDPRTPINKNRVSAAFILRHEPNLT